MKSLYYLTTVSAIFLFIGIFAFDKIISLWKDADPDKSIASAVSYGDYDWLLTERNYANILDKEGPDKLLTKLKLEFDEADDFRTQHAASHIWGALLYRKLGMSGFVHCDSLYNYGCFHGFMDELMTTKGLDFLPKLNVICSEVPSALQRTSCFHGLGHVIVTVYGYEEDDLLPALAKCDDLSFKSNCYSGIFMEFSLQTMKNAPDIYSKNIRSQSGDIFSPCSRLPEKYLHTCYYSQPHWWVRILNYNYANIGQLCAKAPGQDYKKDCFLGIGRSTIWSEKNIIKNVNQVCNTMSTYEYEIFCRSGAAAAIYYRDEDINLALQACVGALDDEGSVRCRHEAAMTVLDRTGDINIAAKMCSGLDTINKTTCLLNMSIGQ